MEGAVLDGKRFPTAAAKRYTLANLIDRYIDDVLPHKSASSIYMQTLQLRWWKAQLGTRRLAEITPPLLATYRDQLAWGTGKHSRSSATIVRYLAALSHAFSVAIREWRWLEENPVRQVTRPKEPRGRVRFLDEAEDHWSGDETTASGSRQR